MFICPRCNEATNSFIEYSEHLAVKHLYSQSAVRAEPSWPLPGSFEHRAKQPQLWDKAERAVDAAWEKNR
jgi:hypothetical protein